MNSEPPSSPPATANESPPLCRPARRPRRLLPAGSPRLKIRFIPGSVKLTRTLKIRLDLFLILPLVNVLFLALILFVLSSRFTLQPGLALRLPTSPFALEPPVNPLVITVTGDFAPALFLRERKVTLQELEESLGDRQLAGRKIIIRADRSTPYERIAEIGHLALTKGFPVALAFAPENEAKP